MDKDVREHSPQSDSGIVSAIVAGFVAGATCVITLLKVFGEK